MAKEADVNLGPNLPIIVTAVVALCSGCRRQNRGIKVDYWQEVYRVSLISLIATPERYDRKLVYVSGYLDLDDEQPRLFLDAEHSRRYLVDNSVWIDTNGVANINLCRTNGQYVVVMAVFHMAEHLGQQFAPGTLCKVHALDKIEFRTSRPPVANEVKTIPGIDGGGSR
jgi:hypothetical protein